jgi:adenylosuccinate lyase
VISLASGIESISPLDGRYASKLAGLTPLVSEAGLIRARIRVECEWLKFLLALSEVRKSLELKSKIKVDGSEPWARKLSTGELVDPLRAVARVKEIERTTNHDVKAVELHVQEVLASAGAPHSVVALVHFGCTSEDINNLAYALIYEQVRRELVVPALVSLIERLASLAECYAKQPMLARTHGQPATPTTFGKEMAVYGARLASILDDVESVRIQAKFNGATGGFSAHQFAMPEIDWPRAGAEFISGFDGIQVNPLTTQIESHDWIARISAACGHLCTGTTGLARDFWQYISDGWCVLKRVDSETGSSTMPHKVNPIDFENAEGNFGVARALFDHFAAKLPVSRLQRDLSDSTTMRNLGVAFGHLLLGLKSMEAGLDRIQMDTVAMTGALNQHWEVLGEAVQSLLRVRGVEGAYAKMKSATRGVRMDATSYALLIDELEKSHDTSAALGSDDFKRLRGLTPATYTGASSHLAEIFVAAWRQRGFGARDAEGVH